MNVWLIFVIRIATHISLALSAALFMYYWMKRKPEPSAFWFGMFVWLIAGEIPRG